MFSPVIQIETLQVLIVLAVQFDWKLDQMDVVGAYPNTTLLDDEVLYINPIPGIHDSSKNHYTYMHTIGHNFMILAVHIDDMVILALNR